MEAIILAGGSGTRLKSIISDIPKPMATIGAKPFLEYIFDWLIKNDIKRVVLSVGYKWEIIYNYYKDSYHELELIYSVEEIPLGTGGAINKAIKLIENDDILIINGDTYFDVNINELASFHKTNQSNLTIALKPMKYFNRYGTVEINDENRILKFREKEHTNIGLINGGIYLLDKNLIKDFPKSERFSFEKDFLEVELDNLKLFGFIKDKYFIDIGIPEDYNKAQLDLPNQINGK